MTTMISSLPSVLIEEIFARVPLKSLRAVRLTCKSWNTLSKSESFTKMYISKASTREEESMMVAMMNNDLYFMRFVVDDVDPSIEFKRKPSFLNEDIRISQIYHCEGLLLCIFEDDDSKVLVWNPYSGQTRWIKQRYSHRPHRWDRFSYALGYKNNKSCPSIKFLRFIDYFYYVPEKQFYWYEIYDFDSGLWKTLDVSPHWCIRFGDHGVSLKGNTYWPAKDRNSVDDLEEKLAALFQHNESNYYELEIWITTKIDVEMVSWSKFLKLDKRPDIVPAICEGFIIDEEKKVFMGFNINHYPKSFCIIGKAGDVRKLDLGVSLVPNFTPDVCSYIPSLVQIKELVQGKRKRESSLEKHRFDQNKLRLAEFEK